MSDVVTHLIVEASRTLSAAALGGARPLLTALLLTIYARFLLHAMLPQHLTWMTHPYTLGALGALAALEHLLNRDADIYEVLHVPMRYVTAVVVVLCSPLIGALTPSQEGPHAPIGVVSTAAQLTAGLASACVGVATHEVRARFHRLLHDASLPRRWLRWLEVGGVAGLLAAVLLSPVLAVLITLALGVASVTMAGVAVVLARAIDARSRRPCPRCALKVRVEAMRCRGCGAQIEPARWLPRVRSAVL